MIGVKGFDIFLQDRLLPRRADPRDQRPYLRVQKQGSFPIFPCAKRNAFISISDNKPILIPGVLLQIARQFIGKFQKLRVPAGVI